MILFLRKALFFLCIQKNEKLRFLCISYSFFFLFLFLLFKIKSKKRNYIFTKREFRKTHRKNEKRALLQKSLFLRKHHENENLYENEDGYSLRHENSIVLFLTHFKTKGGTV